MTPTRYRVFLLIKEFIEKNGYSPTFKEIGDVAGLTSLGSVHKHVHSLIAEGYLVDDPSEKKLTLAVAPTQLFHGFHRCALGHGELFYRGTRCPACNLILASARSVVSSPSTSAV